ncbi:hypothetical protein ACE6H2_020589 [Prunus campanulata]
MNWFVATSSWLLTAKDLPLPSQLKCCDNDGGFSLEFEAQVPFKKLETMAIAITASEKRKNMRMEGQTLTSDVSGTITFCFSWPVSRSRTTYFPAAIFLFNVRGASSTQYIYIAHIMSRNGVFNYKT